MSDRTRHTAAALLIAAAACSGSGGRTDEDLGGLVVAERAAEERPIDVARAAADPLELARAVAQPHATVADALGGHRFRGSSSIEVREGAEVVEAIADETAIAYRSDGSFAATLDNSRDYGRHATFAGGTLYLRPRYGKYHRRAPTDDGEPARIRGDVFATLGAYFELVAPAAAIADAGEVQHAGRAARRLQLSRAAKPVARPAERRPERAWRDEVSVEELTGDVVLDAATGVPLRAALDARVRFVRDGRTFVMTLKVAHEVTDDGSEPEVAAPPDDQVVDTPHRSTEAEERERLLEGIAPPPRKAPTPANPTGAAEPRAP